MDSPLRDMETTKMTKYCNKEGCKTPLFSISFADEDTDEHMRMRLWHSFQELRESKKNCTHGEPEKFTPEPPFKVIGVDTFSNDGDFPLGTFKTLEKALSVARNKGGTMLKTHVYDKNGRHCGDFGTF